MTTPTTSSTSSAIGTIGRFEDARILVVGDAVLDVWHYGASERLCREAPVPVVDVARSELAAGGAANTAVNAAALGASVRYVGITGADRHGDDLRRVLVEHGVAVDHVLRDDSRPTTTKQRLVCDEQVLARFDIGAGTWNAEPLRRLEELTLELAGEVDVVLVCDYQNGALTEAFRRRLALERDRIAVPLVVDAHAILPWRECRPTAVTPNASETMQLLEDRADSETGRLSLLAEHSDVLLERTGAEMVLTTADSDGTLLHRRGTPAYRTYAVDAVPNQTCGAGDTFAATFALGLAVGAVPELAADIAQRAADVVVGRPGTSVCSMQELMYRYVEASTATTVGVEELTAVVEQHRANGRRIVFTNGCFDILHAGHAAYLDQARELGDVLVVGVNSDASVRRLKGRERPIVPEQQRATLVGSLHSVDHVVLFEEDSPAGIIEAIRPDVYVKGGDYTAEMLPEAEVVERIGGEIRFVDYVEDHSTTGIVDRIRRGTDLDVARDGSR